MSKVCQALRLHDFIWVVSHFLRVCPFLSAAFWVFLLTWLSVSWSAEPANAVYPAPWPDANSSDPRTGWTAYTSKANDILDPEGGTDGSTGGTTPQQSADVGRTGGIPSTWFAYSAANDVLFIRLHLTESPINSIPDGTSGSGVDPYSAVTYSLLIDTDGDGYKEFAAVLDGDTGTQQDKFDNLYIYYNNSATQAYASAAPVFTTKSVVSFPANSSGGTRYDFGPSRALNIASIGGSWFLDWQVPMSEFTDASNNRLITPNTKISFAYGTSNSNSNPFQKDFAFQGGFNSGDPIRPVPFGDVLTVSSGITQSPSVTSVTATGCPGIITARVRDTLLAPTSTTVAATVTSVKFYAQRDTNGDGTPDAESPVIYIGERTTPTTPFSDYQITWNSNAALNVQYVVYVVATDDQGNVTNSLTQSPKVYAIYDNTNCGVGSNISGRVYNDVNRNAVLDGAETGTGVTSLYVKLMSGGIVVDSTTVEPTTGNYSFVAPNGTYTLILDDNNLTSDTTSYKPSGYVGIEAPNQSITNVTIATGTTATNQNFGLYNGSILSGKVFHDNGAGGGTAGDGIRNGSEVGLSNVTINLTNSAGGINHGSTTTDINGDYTLPIPASIGSIQLKVTQTNLTSYVSTGGQVGNTGGTYDIDGDATTFTNSVGAAYTGVNFADAAIPVLQVSKTVSPNSIITAGRILTYTISVTNSGAANSSGTTLQDLIPTDTTYVANSTTLNGSAIADSAGAMPFSSTRTLNSAGAPAGQITVGQTATVTFQVQVDNSPGASISNTATVDVDGSGPSPFQTATASSDVARIVISKTANPGGTLVTGEIVTYTITLQNIGNGMSSGTTLVDAIPSGTTYVSGSTTVNGSSVPDNGGAMPFATATQINSVGRTGGQIVSGATVVVTFQAQAIDPPPSVISNTATVDVDGPGVSPGVSATVSNPSVPADLILSITNSQAAATPGAPISYTITVNNAGPGTVSGLHLEIRLPNTIQNPIYTAAQGDYDPAAESWTGITLAPGNTVTLTVSGTVSPSANAPITTTAYVLPSGGVNDPDLSNNSDSNTTTTGVTLSGFVYNDANRNSVLDGIEEGTGVPNLYVKLVPQGAISAIQAVLVDAATGAYSFNGVPQGNYSVIIDDNTTLSDATPGLPSGYISTEGTNGEHADVVVNTSNVTYINLGLFYGSRVTGTVFRDTGSGGGIANDGIRNGSGAGISGVNIVLTDNATTTTYGATVTDMNGNYELFIPAAQANTALKIRETNPVNFISTGAQTGNTANGSYERDTDTVTFTAVPGASYSGVNFGDVPLNSFSNDGATTTTPGNAVFYSHVFTAGSAGRVSFNISRVTIPEGTGFTTVIYHDVNGNGTIEPGEPVLQPTDTVDVNAGQQVSLIVKVNAPPQAPLGAKDVLTVNANFFYTNANPALTSTNSRTDTTTVATPTGLELIKSASTGTASPGQEITYIIAFRNTSDQTMSALVINDFTPSFTTFVRLENGTTPGSLTVGQVPTLTAGQTGTLRWTFNGNLLPDESGDVRFTLKVDG